VCLYVCRANLNVEDCGDFFVVDFFFCAADLLRHAWLVGRTHCGAERDGINER